MAVPIEMLFGLLIRVYARNHVLGGARIPLEKGAFLGGHLQARVFLGFSVSQPYSVADSSDASFRCQYCSNLLNYVTLVRAGYSAQAMAA